jgi:hypothetical protein
MEKMALTATRIDINVNSSLNMVSRSGAEDF